MTRENIEVRSGPARETLPAASRWSYRPAVDVVEDADAFTVYADMPGTTASEIEVDFEDHTLRIHGKVTPRRPVEAEYVAQEYGIGDFDRRLAVSEEIDTESITAEYASGVLVVHLPKSETAKPRHVPVRGAER